MLNIFSCAYWQLVFILWGNASLGLIPIFGLFAFLLLSCMNCLYILDINGNG